MAKKRASLSKGQATKKSAKRSPPKQPEKEKEQKVKVEEMPVKVEKNAEDPPAVKTEEVAVKVEKVEERVLNFPPKPTSVPSFDRDFSPPDDYVPSQQNKQGSGDGPGRSSSVSPSLLLPRRPPPLTIDCSVGLHGSGDAPLSSDSGISVSTPRSRKSPFERYSTASSMAMRQRAMSECLPPSPGLRSILKTPSESDMRFYGPQPRKKTVSFSKAPVAEVHFFKTDNSIEEQLQHAAKNKKKREKKAKRLAKKAKGDGDA